MGVIFIVAILFYSFILKLHVLGGGTRQGDRTLIYLSLTQCFIRPPSCTYVRQHFIVKMSKNEGVKLEVKILCSVGVPLHHVNEQM